MEVEQMGGGTNVNFTLRWNKWEVEQMEVEQMEVEQMGGGTSVVAPVQLMGISWHVSS